MWQQILVALSDAAYPPMTAMIHSTSVSADRPKAQKGGLVPSHRPLAWPSQNQGPSAGGRTRAASRRATLARSGFGYRRCIRHDRRQPTQPYPAIPSLRRRRSAPVADRARTTPVIANQINRVNRQPFDRAAYRLRDAIERAFCRLKDFRNVASPYCKTARICPAGVWLVAAITR